MSLSNVKTILITGATAGIGFQTALELSKQGHRIYITGRNHLSASEAVKKITKESNNHTVFYLLADLSTQKGIMDLVDQFAQQEQHLDVLINNAGSAQQKFTRTADGIEMNFAVNVLAPYLLTNLLKPYLVQSKEPRVITVTGGSLSSNVNPQGVIKESEFSGLDTYSDTKVMMMCVMYDLANELKEKGITCNVCYPGQASTSMTQNVTQDMFKGWQKIIFPLFKLFIKDDNGKSAKKASRSSVYLATEASIAKQTQLFITKKVKSGKWPVYVLNKENRELVKKLLSK